MEKRLAYMPERPRERKPLLNELPASGEVYETARHEVGHGLLGEVIAISVKPQGNVLGWTLLRNVDNVALAAGIYHGEGYGSDKARIEQNARENGVSPDLAVGLAVTEAGLTLGPRQRLIDLMARELAIRGYMSGSEFNELRNRAQREIDGTLETPFEWPWNSNEESDAEQEANVDEITLVVNTTEGTIVETYRDGARTKRIAYTEDGYTIEKFENGTAVESEIWVQVNKDIKGEEPKYEKRQTWHSAVIAQKGTIYSFGSPKASLN